MNVIIMIMNNNNNNDGDYGKNEIKVTMQGDSNAFNILQQLSTFYSYYYEPLLRR